MAWYVTRIHFAQEERAQQNLQRQSYGTLLPLATVYNRRADGLLTSRTRPLFSGYLFVEVAGGQRWQPIMSTYGVSGFVGYFNPQPKPPAVRQQDIDELRQKLAEVGGSFHMGFSRPQDIRPDLMVRILFGPFRDKTALVKADLGSRVKVLLQEAGAWGDIPLKLSKECLTAA